MRKGALLIVGVMTLILCQQAQPQKQKQPGKQKLFEPLQHGEAIELDRAIPANERGILCLASDDQGRIFGGTTGRAAHLFVYDPKVDEVRSLLRLEGGIGFAHALIRLPDGTLIGGTQADPTGIAMETDDKQVGWLYRFTPNKDGSVKADKLGQPVAGQGIYTLAYDEKTQTVMGNTWPDGHFFTFDVKSSKFTDHGAIAGYRPYETPQHAEDLNKGVAKKVKYSRQVSKAIFVYHGKAYTGGKDGYLFEYDPGSQKLTKTDWRIPSIPGREAWASLDVAAATQSSGVLCGSSEGYLFYFPDKMVTPPLSAATTIPSQWPTIGKVGAQGNFHGLVHLAGHTTGAKAGLDAKFGPTFTGVAGSKHGMPRTFVADPNSIAPGKIPRADGQLSMVGFGAMIKDKDGTLYAGEQDRIARLLRFSMKDNGQPAKKAKQPKTPTPKDLPGPAPEENLTKLAGKVTFAPLGTTTDGSGYTAITVGLDGNVYVGTARYGGYAYLLRFDPNQTGLFMDQIVSVQQLVGEHLHGINTQGKIHAIILVGPDGTIYFATKQAHEIFDTRPEYGEDFECYPGGHLMSYNPKTGFAKTHGILKKHEGLMAGAMDGKLNKIYYRSEPKNNFLVHDLKTGETKDRGHTGNFCRYFAMDKDGAVYTPGRGDYLSRYDPQTGYIEDMLIEVVGEGNYSPPYVIEVGPNGKLYGAGTSHPWIMEFDIANATKGPFPKVKMRNVAPAAPKGLPVQDIHAGVFGKDGKFYYPLNTTGPVEKGGKNVAHLRIMRFDPVAGKTETVGIPDTSALDESKVKHCYVRTDKYQLDHMQGAKVGADGTLFLMDIYPQLNVVQFPKLTAPKK